MVGILNLNRRHFLQGTAAAALAGTTGIRLAQAADVTIGIVYVGPRDDYGWNQAHAVAA
ncbi:MAG: Purine-binding protein precursor, partial [Bradyrhizobium sp.]|nr:Purine-binding protein precursor [Bradyrhizobium sp.]